LPYRRNCIDGGHGDDAATVEVKARNAPRRRRSAVAICRATGSKACARRKRLGGALKGSSLKGS
jgi:hypothetical protein